MFKKILIFFVGLGAIAAVVLFIFGNSWLNQAVRSGVVTFGPRITGTAIELESVNLSVLSGSGTLGGFRVANPEGFSDDFIASFGEIDVEINPRSLLSDTIVIRRLHLREPIFLIEQSSAGTNFRVLQANVASFAPPPEEVETQTGAERQIMIEELIIESGRLRGSLFGQSIGVNLPSIRLENVGTGEDGIPVADIVELVLGEILKAIGPALGDLGGRAADIGRDLSERGLGLIEDAAGQTTERIRGLFNRNRDE